MSIYISFVFYNILGYPSNLLLPFFHPRTVVFLITSLFSKGCSRCYFVAFRANILCFQLHSRFGRAGRSRPVVFF